MHVRVCLCLFVSACMFDAHLLQSGMLSDMANSGYRPIDQKECFVSAQYQLVKVMMSSACIIVYSSVSLAWEIMTMIRVIICLQTCRMVHKYIYFFYKPLLKQAENNCIYSSRTMHVQLFCIMYCTRGTKPCYWMQQTREIYGSTRFLFLFFYYIILSLGENPFHKMFDCICKNSQCVILQQAKNVWINRTLIHILVNFSLSCRYTNKCVDR